MRKNSVSARICRHCGTPIPADSRSTYCSERCRRKYQDKRRKDERAEARLYRQRLKTGFGFELVFVDADRPELYGNPLTSEWLELLPCGFPSCPDESIDGPIACQTCPRSLFWEG